MKTTGKIVFIVLDGVGIGELPDASLYGDVGANTLVNTARAVNGLNVPNLEKLGMGNIAAIQGVKRMANADGCFGKMAEVSKGKDSTTGHWEISGIIVEKDFPYYPHGFPAEVLDKFCFETGVRGVLGNTASSGTVIIQELGDEHVRTGFPIVYTSADSVFQIAAHTDVIPLPALYEMCKRTREKVMTGNHAVGRVIARPFVGTSGHYVRTPDRKDFSLDAPGATVLDVLFSNDIATIAIGKIDDLFSGRGLKEKIHTRSNSEGIEQIIVSSRALKKGLVMANLVDFDMLFGHRQDAKGMAQALEDFDRQLPRILETLNDGDVVMITADHGNDPTDNSTDHSREYVPILCYNKTGKKNVSLGVRKTYADAGKTIADYFGFPAAGLAGNSFLTMLQ